MVVLIGLGINKMELYVIIGWYFQRWNWLKASYAIKLGMIGWIIIWLLKWKKKIFKSW
jgi:hypothetical protein